MTKPIIPSKTECFRTIEKGIIALFLLTSLVIFILIPSAPAQIEEGTSTGTTQVIAIASAMPNQGWTPFTVYFSAFGSYTTGNDIVKIEWDLDGNGILDTDATAAGGYASYTFVKPGEYNATLRVTDDFGNTATDSVVISARHPVSSSVDYWSVFDDSSVGKITIEISQRNWDKLWLDPLSKKEVIVDAIVFGERLEDAGFRMRGQFSLVHSGDKKPWRIDLNTTLPKQTFHELKALLLLNNIGDSSLLQEKLAYDMMHFAGVQSSFVRYVELWFDFTDDNADPVFWGVYTMVERIDNKFIGNRYGQDARGGNLYAASHAQRGPMDLVYYGPKITDCPITNGQYAYGKENNIEEYDYSDIINLCYVISGATYETPEDFAAALEEVFNVDSYLRYIAVSNAIMNWDSYPFTGNNFYLFNNPVTGKFEWIPWDLEYGRNSEMDLFDRDEEALSPYAPLYEKVFEVDRYKRQYLAYLDLLTRHIFNYETVYEKASTYHQLIAPYLSQGSGDRMFYGETALFTIEEFNNSWMDLAENTRDRYQYIQNALAPYQ
jgi:spore coat protein CotH